MIPSPPVAAAGTPNVKPILPVFPSLFAIVVQDTELVLEQLLGAVELGRWWRKVDSKGHGVWQGVVRVVVYLAVEGQEVASLVGLALTCQ